MEKPTAQPVKEPHLKKSEPLTQGDFEKFTAALQAMCPGDYSDPEGSLSKRALIAWNIFEKRGWTSEELAEVLDRFARKHQSRDWYPRTFLEHHEELFGSDDMVI